MKIFRSKFSSIFTIFLLVFLNFAIFLFFDKIQMFLTSLNIGFRFLFFFFVGFFGNFGFFSPISYTYLAFVFSTIKAITIIELVIPISLGSAFGEMISWVLGRSFYSLLPRKKINKIEKFIKSLQKSKSREFIIWILIVFFALTPLPDDILLLILGTLRYSFLKTLFFCFLGKCLMILAISTAGKITSFYINSHLALMISFILLVLFYLPIFNERIWRKIKKFLNF